jgi:tetratricopeptide (TPR) repeat protein
MALDQRGTARMFARSILWLAVLLAALTGSCGTDKPADGGDGKGSSRAGGQQKPSGGAPATGDRLAEIERNAEAAITDRDWPLARKLIDDGSELAKEGGHEYDSLRGRLLLLLGDVERENGQEVESRRCYADAMAIFRVQGDDVGRFTVHLAQGELEASRGDYAAAARELGSAEGLLAGIDDQVLKGDFLIHSGRLAARQMRHEDAQKAFAEAARIFDIVKDRGARARALLLLADEEDALDKTRQARRSLDKALAIFREVGDREGEVRALHKAAAIAVREGQHKKARSLLTKVRDLYYKLDRQSDAAKVQQHLSSLPE